MRDLARRKKLLECMLRLFLMKWKNPHESAVFMRIHKNWYVLFTTNVGRFASSQVPIPDNLPKLVPIIVEQPQNLYKHQFNILSEFHETQILKDLESLLKLFGLRMDITGSLHSDFERITIKSGKEILGAIVIIPDPKER